MIGETREELKTASSKTIIAVRDALVVFFLLLVTKLIDIGYPPTVEAVYTAILPAILMGIISYMHAAGIEKPLQ